MHFIAVMMPAFLSFIIGAATPERTISETLNNTPNIIDAATVVPDLLVELKYATKDNFLKQNVYGDLHQCFLHKDATKQLAEAAKWLNKRDANLRFLAYDCLRPRQVQLIMWDAVKGTAQQSYVANPHSKIASIHNYGCAIDLTLSKADGTPLDMGTPFDHFGHEAQPRYEIKMLTNGKISPAALANRLLLREVMVRAGFYPIANEWWHFNCVTSSQVQKRYKIIE